MPLLSTDDRRHPGRMWVTKEEFEEDGYSILPGPRLGLDSTANQSVAAQA